MNCSKHRNKILTKNCELKKNILPFSQKLGIHLMKLSPKSLLKSITNNCSKWKEPTDPSKIADFIKEYEIDWKQCKKCKNSKNIEECSKNFHTLNEFFQREIPISINQLPKNIVISPAECRLMYYSNVRSAKKFWIKGETFTIKKLLNRNLPIFKNCSIIICRLAPDDYHRFHFPIDCIYMGNEKIDGDYYSVNPIIVNSSIDVYTVNKREIHYLYSNVFGNVVFIIIGATCTGSIEVENLKHTKFYTKGTLFGKFGFGGSTIVMLFEKNKLNIDKPIILNTKNMNETYLKVGEIIGTVK